MRDLIKGGYFVILSLYGLVKVLRVQAYVESVPSGLQGYVREDTHFVSQENRSNHAFFDHFIEGALDLVFYAYLQLGMLDRGDVRVSLDGVGP